MATINHGTKLIDDLKAALGLQGRHVRRVVIDVQERSLVTATITETLDGDQVDRVIKLLDAAEKVEVDARDHHIVHGDPRAEEPKGVIFSVPGDE